jgi:hypothetical protein
VVPPYYLSGGMVDGIAPKELLLTRVPSPSVHSQAATTSMYVSCEIIDPIKDKASMNENCLTERMHDGVGYIMATVHRAQLLSS